MANDGNTVERLRGYLRELKPQALALLMSEVERAVNRGDDVTGGDLILNELRQILRDTGSASPRNENAVRLFFHPLEPFLVNDVVDHRHPCRIARASLMPIWNWISRELLPEQSRRYYSEAAAAYAELQPAQADELARTFQALVAKSIVDAFEAVARDDKAGRRLRSQIGIPRAAEIATLVAHVFAGRVTFDRFAESLPDRISDLSGAMLADVKARIDADIAGDDSLLSYLLVVVMSRLQESWQLVRLAVSAAGSDYAVRVAERNYAIAVTMVLAELERLVGELRSELRGGRGMGAGLLLKQLHDGVRGLRTEIDIPAESNWGRQLATLRTQISELVRAEIEAAPGRVRRLLRPRPASEVRPGAILDSEDVAETERLVEFVGICRNFAGELAFIEVAQRSYTELQTYLDNATRTMIDSLRHAGPGDRPFRASQVDAAVRFCGRMFGADYAAMMQRSADAAMTDAATQARA